MQIGSASGSLPIVFESFATAQSDAGVKQVIEFFFSVP
jgi:hypothetical protein